MKRFYFTFGTDELFPYQDGWVEILADDIRQAAKIFKAIYPNPRDDSILNCADYYSEDVFKKSIMYKRCDNFGTGCHEIISIQRMVLDV